MIYDFDARIERRNTDSEKWDVAEGELPMWVADMDFAAAPAVQKALEETVARRVFGYSVLPDEWYDAYIRWWDVRHGFRMEREWLCFATGVIPILSSVIRRLTVTAEKVAVLSPVYNVFFGCIEHNGRVPVEVPLRFGRDGEGRISADIDFAALEDALADPQTTMLLFCNPHNPVGRLWDRETLAEIGELAARHGVTVVSDEIHCDITAPGKEYIPFASVNDTNRRISVTCIAPTKAFNLAGIHTAAVCVPDPFLRARVVRGLWTDDVAEPGSFAVPAAVAAFNEGGDWLDAMNAYVRGNMDYAEDFLLRELPDLEAVPGNATYLMWIHIGKIAEDSEEFCTFLREKTGLFVSPGSWYRGNGKHFFRLNVACPRSVVEDGMNRLKRGVVLWTEEKAARLSR